MSNRQITLRAIAALIPYARNARTHNDEQVAQIAASIREFGWTNPILVDGENGVLAGHGRLMAARRLRDAGATIRDWTDNTTVPVIELSGLSEVQKKAYILADNKIAMNAGWDIPMLAVELEEIRGFDFDMGLTGFSVDDVQRIGDDMAEINLRALGATPPANSAPPVAPPIAPPVAPAAGTPAQATDAAQDGGAATGATDPAQGNAAPPADPPPAADMVPFQIVLTTDQRSAVFDAIKTAKEVHGCATSGDALFAIVREWIESRTAAGSTEGAE